MKILGLTLAVLAVLAVMAPGLASAEVYNYQVSNIFQSPIYLQVNDVLKIHNDYRYTSVIVANQSGTILDTGLIRYNQTGTLTINQNGTWILTNIFNPSVENEIIVGGTQPVSEVPSLSLAQTPGVIAPSFSESNATQPVFEESNATNPQFGFSNATNTMDISKESLITDVLQNPIPTWVKGVFGYWAEGKLSDQDLLNAIEFLIKVGVLQLN